MTGSFDMVSLQRDGVETDLLRLIGPQSITNTFFFAKKIDHLADIG